MNTGTPFTAQQLVTNAAPLDFNESIGTRLRWAIQQMNQLASGNTPQAYPVLTADIAASSAIYPQASDWQLLSYWAVLVTLMLGGSQSGSKVIHNVNLSGAGNPNTLGVDGNPGDLYFDTSGLHLYYTSSQPGTTWTLLI